MLTVILITSLLPAQNLPHLHGSDKLHHLLSYAVLAWWTTLAFQKNTLYQVTILAFLLILFSGMIELLQGLSGYRYAEWYDLLANCIGVFVGCILAFRLTSQCLIKLDRRLQA